MKIALTIRDITQFEADAIIVSFYEDMESMVTGGSWAVNQVLGGLLEDEMKHGTAFKGKIGDTLVIPTYGKLPCRYVVLVGLGKQSKIDNKAIRRASASAIRVCKKLKVKSVGSILHGSGMGGMDPQVSARLVVEGTLLGAYDFKLRKTGLNANQEPSKEPLFHEIEAFDIVEMFGDKKPDIETGLLAGLAIGQSVNLARDLIFDSANFVTPEFMAQMACSIRSPFIQCKVLEQTDLEILKMGSFLSVAKGSVQPPKLIHLTYQPKNKSARKKITLVGKGITFDSGGLSLKPAASMELMKDDMSGGAAVLAVFKALSLLDEIDIQVDGIIPACENMPNGNANKPGDIVTSMNGQTIEINNTDAEGRLILCDALTYAQKEVEPDEIIDLATLTGACIIALGKEAAGIMGTDDGLITSIREAGDRAGEKYWQLPLYDEYKDFLKSDVADLKNAGNKGEAGSSAGGMFLKAFIKEGQKWVHCDIAGPAYIDKDVPEVPKGATGTGVRTLLYYLCGFQ